MNVTIIVSIQTIREMRPITSSLARHRSRRGEEPREKHRVGCSDVAIDYANASSGDRDCCAGAVPMRELSGSEQAAPPRSQALDGPARNGAQDGVRAMHDINRQNLALRVASRSQGFSACCRRDPPQRDARACFPSLVPLGGVRASRPNPRRATCLTRGHRSLDPFRWRLREKIVAERPASSFPSTAADPMRLRSVMLA